VLTREELAERESANRKLATKVIRLNYLRADEAAAFVNPMLSERGAITVSGNVGDGIQPTLDDAGSDNYSGPQTLVLRDYEDQVEEITALIKDLDVQPKQVIIEATILNTSLTENNQFGVDFSLFSDLSSATSPLNGILQAVGNESREGAITSEQGFNSNSTTKLGFVAGDAAVFVSALDDVADTTVIATPKTTVLDRNRANIQVGSNVPFLTTTVSETSSTQTIEFLETGTQLTVRPFVADDGKIRLELRPSVSSAESVDVGGGQTAPQEDTVEIITNVIVDSGQTIVLGGLFRESTSVSRSQVPGLGGVPLIGKAFQGQDDTIGREEIIFMVKATVVENETLADIGDETESRVNVAKVADRGHLLPWSRTKLTASHLLNARKHYDAAQSLSGAAREKKMAQARYCVDLALHLDPSMVDALRLKEKITGQAAYIDYEGSNLNQSFDKVLNKEMKDLGVPDMPDSEAKRDAGEPVDAAPQQADAEPSAATGDAQAAAAEAEAADATQAGEAADAAAESDEQWLKRMLAAESQATAEPDAEQADATEPTDAQPGTDAGAGQTADATDDNTPATDEAADPEFIDENADEVADADTEDADTQTEADPESQTDTTTANVPTQTD